MLSGNPTATETELREAFEATALDLAPAGVDNRTGHGIIRADRVLEYTGATPQPLVRAQQPQLGAITGDGDAYLEPGETATLRLPVTNVGDGTATGISVTATTDDPLAVLTPRNRNYGDLPAGATTSRDFTLALDDDFPLGKRVRIADPRDVRRRALADQRDVQRPHRPAGDDAAALRLHRPGGRRSRTPARSARR